MFHAVDFINCRVNAVFSHKDANGNINREFHHKGSSRVSQLYVVNHQREQGEAKDCSLRYASTDVRELCFYSTDYDSVSCDSGSLGSN